MGYILHALSFVLIQGLIVQPSVGETCLAAIPCPTSKVMCMGALFRTCGDCDLSWCKNGATTPEDDCQIQLVGNQPTCVQKATARTTSAPVTTCRAPQGVSIPGLGSAPPASVKEPVTLLVCRQEGFIGGVKLRCTVPQVYEVDGECNRKKPNPLLRRERNLPPPPMESPLAAAVVSPPLPPPAAVVSPPPPVPTTCEEKCALTPDRAPQYCTPSFLPASTVVAQCKTSYYSTYCPKYCCLNTPAPAGCAPPAPIAPPTTPPPPPVRVNKCFCDNGSEAVGDDCDEDGLEICMTCDRGFKINWATSKCDKAEVRCDSYRRCPADQPVIDDASSVVCTRGVCRTPQCCKREVRCNSFARCDEYTPLKSNASSIVCTNGNCTSRQCCRKDPNCPRNFTKDTECQRTCQCVPKMECQRVNDRTNIKKCHC